MLARVLGAHAQRAPAPAQRFVCRIEQRVFLQSAGAQGRGARREYRRRAPVSAAEVKLDLAFQQ